MQLAHETTGDGPVIVFLHAGIADSRMWESQWTSFAARHRLLRCDLAGFGRTPLEGLRVSHARDVVELLDGLGVRDVGLIGASLGGRVALEVGIARPDLVAKLVLVDPGLPGVAWSDATQASWAAEDEAVARGDLEAAVELCLRMWVDGPRRESAEVDPAVRAGVAEMQLRALELQAPTWEAQEEDMLVPDVADRLGEVEAPTLVVVGDEDIDDMQVVARKLAAEIPGARLATISGAAHLPSLEQPAAFNELALAFLS